MSSPLAIGAVSAVLRNLLDDGMIEATPMGSPVKVSAVAPDTIDLEAEKQPRLNLFLHQVTTNAGWSNHGLPSRGAAHGERLTNPPLALDLHYVLTAYSRLDCEAEILLGYAMHLLHEWPVIDRQAIRRALDPSPLDPDMVPEPVRALALSDLADQVEQIKITPAAFSGDDMSKLWSAISTHYRPSAAYLVSVVLIEARRPAVSPLPVLTRGKPVPGTGRDEGVAVNPDLLPPVPTLFEARPQKNQVAARLGEPVTIEGARLDGTGHEVRLMHRLFSTPVPVSPATVGAGGKAATFTLPPAPASLAAGPLSATIRFIPDGETETRETNAIPLVLAPDPAITPTSAVRVSDPPPLQPRPRVEVTLATLPEVRLEQSAILILDTFEALARPRALASDLLVFEFPDSLPAGTYWARLRVDGTESILIDRTKPVPAFDTSQKISVP